MSQNGHISLSGKTVFITGGSVGIGLEVAFRCAEAGARVIIAARNEGDLKTALSKIQQKNKDCTMLKLDVGNQAEVKKAAAWVKEKYGALDGLVNCAGVYGPIGPLNEVNMDEFTQAIQINFLGTVYMCHFFAPLLSKPNARIINFSGGGAATPFPNYSAYATSKIAIVRLTENLSEEYKPLGISVNAVAPGFVVTRLHEQTLKAGAGKAGQGFLDKTKQEMEKGGVSPEISARLTVYLLSELSNGVNGKFISAPWDDWKNPDFIEKLKAKKNLTTLRRIDNKSFSEIS